MSKNPVLYKSLAVSVIVLFIGLGIQPAFAITSNSIESDDDCNLCPKASKKHIDRLINLLDRLERYDTQLSELFNQYPEFEEKYQEILVQFDVLSELNEINLPGQEWNYPIICGIIGIIDISLRFLMDFIDSIIYSLPGLFGIFVAFFGMIICFLGMYLIGLSSVFGC
jgi:hypothetical protein